MYLCTGQGGDEVADPDALYRISMLEQGFNLFASGFELIGTALFGPGWDVEDDPDV